MEQEEDLEPDIVDFDTSDFPGPEVQVRQHLQLLFESTAASEAEPPLGWSEKQMLLQFLVTDRDCPLNQSSSDKDYRRKRFPFLYSVRRRAVHIRTEEVEENAAGTKEQHALLADNEGGAGVALDGAEPGETEQNAEAKQLPPSNNLTSRSNAAMSNTEMDGIESVRPMSTVFTKESIEIHGGGGGGGNRAMSSILSDGGPASTKQSERSDSLQTTNLLVWHRYSEIPFDISSSDFTVKTPVLPLVQGGHLVFLTSKCGQRTIHYSVKIIKKANITMGSSLRAKRRHSFTNQAAIINKDEFLVLKKLAHPFVASLLYFCENQLLYYYFFPQYSLANLGSSSSMSMRIDVNVCVYVTCCIINAVEYLYRNCIVHRDISSKCVLFNTNFKPLLFHFDYATFFGTIRSSVACLTFLPEMSSRAPEVISAEICKSCEPEHYANCDIWGIGVLMGELLLNSLVMMRALKRKLDLHWVFSVREGGPDDPVVGRSHSTVPKDLMDLLRMCLRKYPQDRPTIHTLMQNPLFAKYDVPNVHTVHCKASPLINDFHRLL